MHAIFESIDKITEFFRNCGAGAAKVSLQFAIFGIPINNFHGDC